MTQDHSFELRENDMVDKSMHVCVHCMYKSVFVYVFKRNISLIF